MNRDFAEEERAKNNFINIRRESTKRPASYLTGDTNTIRLSEQARRQNMLSGEKLKPNSTVDQVTSILGPFYCGGFFLGGCYGIYNVLFGAKNKRRSQFIKTKLINGSVKYGEKFGSGIGGAILLYICTTKLLRFVFLEEQTAIGEFPSALINGAVAGALFKCAYGLKPMLLTAGIGTCFSGLLYFGHKYGYDRYLTRRN
jgi:hypothetical protein